MILLLNSLEYRTFDFVYWLLTSRSARNSFRQALRTANGQSDGHRTECTTYEFLKHACIQCPFGLPAKIIFL